MKIQNKTGWNTADIKRVVVDVLIRVGAIANASDDYSITIGYSKRGMGFGGFGWYYRKRIQINMPGPSAIAAADVTVLTGEMILQFARVVAHEFDHNTGLKHGDMVPTSRRVIPGFDPSAFEIRWTEATPSRRAASRTPYVRHPKNPSPFKSLDRIAADPRVVEIEYDEVIDGESPYEIWVYLRHGHINEMDGIHLIHEWTVRDTLSKFGAVVECDCDACTGFEPDLDIEP